MSRKILIVDDDKGILEAISLILDGEGYEVKSLTSWHKIYETINSFSPDLIILDVFMSGSDGRNISAKIKKDEKTKSIPVILISAHPSVKDSKFIADDFIEKPFEYEDFMNKISRYLTPVKV